MQEDFINFKDEEQRNKVLNLFYLVLSQNKTIDSISIDYVNQYLNDEDAAVFLELMSKYLNMNKPELNKESIKHNDDFKYNITYVNFNKINQIKRRATPSQTFKLVWEEITPYTILGIEKKDYTKEELLEIIGKKINFLLNHEIDKKNEKIDEILDVYNEIIKESNKQR